MTSASPDTSAGTDASVSSGAAAGSGADPAELAGELRTAVSRLAYHLRTPATRSGITPTRLSALAALDKTGPCRPGDLATRLGIKAASMSRLAEILQSAGWARRTPDPDDQRAYLLALTDQGRDTLAALRREGTSSLTTDIGSLDPDQRASLAAAIPVLVALADRHLDQEGTGTDRAW